MSGEFSDPFEVALHDLEQRLFGSWLAGPALRARWTPDPADFGKREHAAIAQACAAMAAEGRDGNLEMALNETLRTLRLHNIWPVERYPLEGVSSRDPESDLHRWRELRCLIALRQSLTSELSRLTPGSPLSDVRARVLESTSKAYVSGSVPTMTLAEWRTAGVASMTHDATSGAAVGYQELDQHCGGLRPGAVWVLGAPTNWGKSSWLLSVADSCLSSGRSVLLVTCEDDPVMLAARHVCRNAGITGSNARHGRLTHQEREAAAALLAATPTGGNPVIADGRGRPVEILCEQIRNLHARNRISVVLVDYLQCIATESKFYDRRGQINHIARSLTDTIKGIGAAGVLASQLTGEDIRESRDVEHAAEVVLIGRKSDDGLSLYLKKNKSGPNDQVIWLQWDNNTGSFKTDDWMVAEDGFFDDQAEPYR